MNFLGIREELPVLWLGDSEDIGAVWAREAHFTFVRLGRLVNNLTVPALEEDDIRYGAVVAAIAGAWYACIYLLLYEIALTFASDAQLRFVRLYGMDIVYACYCVWVHAYMSRFRFNSKINIYKHEYTNTQMHPTITHYQFIWIN